MTIVVRGALLPVAPEASDSEACLRPVRLRPVRPGPVLPGPVLPGQWDRIRETSAIAWLAVRPANRADQRPPFNMDLERRLKLLSAGADHVTNLPMTKACRRSGAATALFCDIAHVRRTERYGGRASREVASLINRVPK
jgi:hypothetical protein